MLETKTKHRNVVTLSFEVMPNIFMEIYSTEFGSGASQEAPLYDLLQHRNHAGREWETQQRLKAALRAAGKSEQDILFIEKGPIR